MKFQERKQFLFDAAVFRLSDTQTALKIYKDFVTKFSPNPPPKFMEVDRAEMRYDDLWHFPISDRTKFSRVLDIPAINEFQKPDWRLTRVGLVAQRRDNFYLSHLHLRDDFDYFPTRGDMVSWNGYRYMIINVVLDPKSYWGQTGVWTGLCLECSIPAEGDAKPLIDIGTPVPKELQDTNPRPNV